MTGLIKIFVQHSTALFHFELQILRVKNSCVREIEGRGGTENYLFQFCASINFQALFVSKIFKVCEENYFLNIELYNILDQNWNLKVTLT